MKSRLWFAAAILFAALALPRAAWALSVNDVIQMHRDDIADSLIILKIENSGKVFHLNPDDLRRLKDEDVSDDVVAAMLDTEGDGRQQDRSYGSYGYGPDPYYYRYDPYYGIPYYPSIFFSARFGCFARPHRFGFPTRRPFVDGGPRFKPMGSVGFGRPVFRRHR